VNVRWLNVPSLLASLVDNNLTWPLLYLDVHWLLTCVAKLIPICSVFQKATSLTHRPFLHCTTLPVVAYLSTAAAHLLFGFPRLERWGLVLLVAFLSHHLRDAWRRGLWLPPFSNALPVSYMGYLLAVAALPNLVRWYVMWRTALEVPFEEDLKALAEAEVV
jgi:hypothetical protein